MRTLNEMGRKDKKDNPCKKTLKFEIFGMFVLP